MRITALSEHFFQTFCDLFAPFSNLLYNIDKSNARTACPSAEKRKNMKISPIFRQKKAVWSFEIFPPKPTADPSAVQNTIAELSALHPDYISVTCSAGGSGNARTGEIASLVKSFGVEPLAHVTCINSDKPSVRAALSDLRERGIENVLALRGDRLPDREDSKDFFHASDLVGFIRSEGYDFDIAGACYPEGHPESKSLPEDIRNLKHKTDAGVSHLNTQLFFDNEDFYRFRDMLSIAGIDVPVQAGVMPLVKKGHVDRIISLSGAKIPAKISRMISRFYDRPEALMEAGIAYAVDQIVDLLSAGAQGIHLYVMNNPYVAKRITDSVQGILNELNGAQNADRP